MDSRRLIQIVCSCCNVELDKLFSRSREDSVIVARHMCMYFLREKFGFSYPKIGKIMATKDGKKFDHTSVLHAVRTLSTRISTKEEMVVVPFEKALEIIKKDDEDDESSIVIIQYPKKFPVAKIASTLNKAYSHCKIRTVMIDVVEVEFPLDNGEFDYKDVHFSIKASYGNHGIGSFEYWGSKERDDQWGWEIEDITWDKSLYNGRENKVIEEFVDNSSDLFFDHFERRQHDL